MTEGRLLDRIDELICAARVVGSTEEGRESQALFSLYREIREAAEKLPLTSDDRCPYTHSHVRRWCGRPLCRES